MISSIWPVGVPVLHRCFLWPLDALRQLPELDENTFLRMSYVRGDTAGSVAFASHVLLAAAIAFGGAIQLIPRVRKRAVSVHRWIGRVFFVTALGFSASGLYMEWIRGDRESMLSGFAISLNAVFIILFCVLAWPCLDDAESSRDPRRRGEARRHVRRLLEFRLLAGAARRSELYLRAKESHRSAGQFTVAGVLFFMTLIMAAGIAGAAASCGGPCFGRRNNSQGRAGRGERPISNADGVCNASLQASFKDDTYNGMGLVMIRERALKTLLLFVGLFFVAGAYPLITSLWQRNPSDYPDQMMR